MSRIGKQPIALPKGVKYTVQGKEVLVEGPKGKLKTPLPEGITLAEKDGHMIAERKDDSLAPLHGLTRALLFNAVEGVTKGWTRELDIVGIGYRAEMKGKGMVVFTLGYSHPIEFPLPTGVDAAIDRPMVTKITAANRSKIGQWWFEHKRILRPVLITAGIVVIVVVLILEIIHIAAG